MDPYDELLQLLLDLDGVRLCPRHHPEGDALYHSLQVLAIAQREVEDLDLLAAALLHDVGKAVDLHCHAQAGGALLEGLVAPRAAWLVTHHMDLLREPAATRQRYRGQTRLRQLEMLRRWDLEGRSPHRWVESPEMAVGVLTFADFDDHNLPPQNNETKEER